jgi:hypothetical protein
MVVEFYHFLQYKLKYRPKETGTATESQLRSWNWIKLNAWITAAAEHNMI